MIKRMEEQHYSETQNESAELDELTEEGRARIRKEQAEMRAHRKPAKGLVVINTGNGKGKTTAALGVLFRAWGQNMRVVMLQFLKSV
jgi:cob(I)alamin adenosyltransferase